MCALDGHLHPLFFYSYSYNQLPWVSKCVGMYVLGERTSGQLFGIPRQQHISPLFYHGISNAKGQATRRKKKIYDPPTFFFTNSSPLFHPHIHTAALWSGAPPLMASTSSPGQGFTVVSLTANHRQISYFAVVLALKHTPQTIFRQTDI